MKRLVEARDILKQYMSDIHYFCDFDGSSAYKNNQAFAKHVHEVTEEVLKIDDMIDALEWKAARINKIMQYAATLEKSKTGEH